MRALGALALPALLLATVPCLFPACGNSASGPKPVPASATQAATLPGSLAEATAFPNSTTLPALTEPSDVGIEAVPPLIGYGIVTKMPDGQLWSAYPNGMAYQTIKNGASLEPNPGQTVFIFYKAYNATTGELFDQTKPGHPYSFRLGSTSVPEGLSIAVYIMQRDSERRWWIPANLAYGVKGIPGKLPPNTPVIYDITLQQWEGNIATTLNLRKPQPAGPPNYLGPMTGPTTSPAIPAAPAPAGPSGPAKP